MQCFVTACERVLDLLNDLSKRLIRREYSVDLRLLVSKDCGAQREAEL